MKEQKKKGMRLRLTPYPRKKDMIWLIQAIVAMLAGVVLALTVTSLAGIEDRMVLAVMAGIAVWIGIIYGILKKNGHENWFYIGALILMLVVTVVFREQVLEGFRIFWNQASEAMLRGEGWVLKEWELQLEAGQRESSVLLFGGVLTAGIVLVCCVLTSFAPVVLSILLPVVLILGMTLFGVDARLWWLLPILGAAVMVLMYSDWRNKGAIYPVVLSWGICAVVTCFLIVGTSMPVIRSWVQATNEQVQQSIHENKYETKYTSLPEGNFSEYKITDRKAEPALAVTMEVPQQMYLRGFTGASFIGESWQSLDGEALVKNKQLLYWLNLNAFDQNAQFDGAAAYAQVEKSTVTVQNIGACSYYLYVPFSISKGTWTRAENLNTDGVYGDGQRSYAYSVTTGTGETINQVINHLQTSDDPAVLQYRRAESGYRQFINHYYLQLSDSVRELLSPSWDEIAGKYGSANNLTLVQAQECACIFLSQCFTEEGTPEDMELPLETVEGTSFQYATVAAMTLRYFGIPARYVEGYVISEEMAAGFESGETMTVDSSCAKAWVEVYQDGIGWLPMDLTPGMGEMLDTPDNPGKNDGEGTSNKNAAQQQEEEEEEDTPEEEEQQEPIGGSVVMLLLKKLLAGLLSLLPILLLILLILWVRRKVLLGRKEKKFRCKDCSDGVAWIFADIALILEKLGFDRGNGSMRSLREPLEEKYGAELAAQYEQVTDLNDLALFSNKTLCEAERHSLLKFRSWILRKLNSEMKWYKRMWFKWIRCLY